VSNGHGLCDLHRNQSVETSPNRPRRAQKEEEAFLYFSAEVVPFVLFLICCQREMPETEGHSDDNHKTRLFPLEIHAKGYIVVSWLLSFPFGFGSCCSGAYIVAVIAFTFQIERWLVAISTLKNNMQRDICVRSYQPPRWRQRNISPCAAAAACFQPASLGGA